MYGIRTKISNKVIIILVGLFSFFCIEIAISLSSQSCDAHAESPNLSEFLLTKGLAQEKVMPSINTIWQTGNMIKGLRALQHQEVLPPLTKVKPASGIGDAEGELTCDNACWLFFIDKEPGAHFAHPVTIILYDVVTGGQKEMDTEWWPEVSGPSTATKQLFNTHELRTNKEMIIYEQLPALQKIQIEPIDPPLTLDDNILNHPLTCDGCVAWAIIVCGYDDLPDTFDEDTNGIYNVLKTLGLSDDHIYYLSPHDHPGVDDLTSKDNVQWAIQEVADQACENDKIFLFYSSHGNTDVLTCINTGISANELDSWLDTIEYQEMAIIIEACHSGSFIGKYKDGSYIAAEDNLTNSGEKNRVVFTSASTDTSSYPDIDGTDDPNEATDIGSESVYGYIMAFGVPGSDTNGNGAVSFSEGVQHAMDNDVTLIRGVNTPQYSETLDLNPYNVYHYCYPIADPNGPYLESCIDGEAEFHLDGSGSYAPLPCDGSLTFAWDTDCPQATFSDTSAVSPVLTLSPINQCINCDAWLTVTCSDGSSETRLTDVIATDNTLPSITCPTNVTINCEDLADPGNTGFASSYDNCDPNPAVTYSDVVDPGYCPNEETITRTWTATDGCGNLRSCNQIITVEDTEPPVINCNVPVSITPPDAPISFNATAKDNCDGSPSIEIISYDCSKFTKKGKRVDKTDSCVVEIVGDKITILDSGGVDDLISWTVEAVDACGNDNSLQCEVTVINPGH